MGSSSSSGPTVEPTASKPTKSRSARAGGMSLKGILTCPRQPVYIKQVREQASSSKSRQVTRKRNLADELDRFFIRETGPDTGF